MKIPWDKVKAWHKKALIVMGLTAALIYLYPKAIYVFGFIRGVIQFQVRIPEYNRDIEMLLDYIKVDKGLAVSQMDRVDSLDRYVLLNIDGKQTEVKVDVRLGHSGDCKIFVKDGSVGMYGAYYNYSEGNWEYYDFDHKYHLTYTKK
jgi:hypothetical protein